MLTSQKPPSVQNDLAAECKAQKLEIVRLTLELEKLEKSYAGRLQHMEEVCVELREQILRDQLVNDALAVAEQALNAVAVSTDIKKQSPPRPPRPSPQVIARLLKRQADAAPPLPLQPPRSLVILADTEDSAIPKKVPSYLPIVLKQFSPVPGKSYDQTSVLNVLNQYILDTNAALRKRYPNMGEYYLHARRLLPLDSDGKIHGACHGIAIYWAWLFSKFRENQYPLQVAKICEYKKSEINNFKEICDRFHDNIFRGQNPELYIDEKISCYDIPRILGTVRIGVAIEKDFNLATLETRMQSVMEEKCDNLVFLTGTLNRAGYKSVLHTIVLARRGAEQYVFCGNIETAIAIKVKTAKELAFQIREQLAIQFGIPIRTDDLIKIRIDAMYMPQHRVAKSPVKQGYGSASAAHAAMFSSVSAGQVTAVIIGGTSYGKGHQQKK